MRGGHSAKAPATFKFYGANACLWLPSFYGILYASYIKTRLLRNYRVTQKVSHYK